MKSWIDGDLTGVDPRAEQELLLETLRGLAEDGGDPTPLVHALAELDPVACAELVCGPRAVAHPSLVRAALPVASELEGVLPPAGLYRRLVDLAPSMRGEVVAAATARHGGVPWVWRLARSEVPPGGSVLRALVTTAGPREASELALAAGCRRAVVSLAAEGELDVLRLLFGHTPRDLFLAALAGYLDGGHDGPVVAWVAAWHGPDVDPMFAAVAERLRTDVGRARLHHLSADLPRTRRALEDA